MDRQELRGNTLLVLANFGDHSLHHLFPTLDHGLLQELYDVFFETLMEFEAECMCYSWLVHFELFCANFYIKTLDASLICRFETIKGQFQQLSRIEPMQLDSRERYRLKYGKATNSLDERQRQKWYSVRFSIKPAIKIACLELCNWRKKRYFKIQPTIERNDIFRSEIRLKLLLTVWTALFKETENFIIK